MKLVKTVQCKLKPTEEEWTILKKTTESFASACNYILKISQNKKTTNRFKLQTFCYKKVREKFHLTANLTIRSIGRVSQSIKKKPRKIRFFKAISVDYDQRIFSYNSHKEQVSLSTIKGRLKIFLNLGNYQRYLLKDQSPIFAVLVYKKRKKEFYINMVLSKEISQISKKGNPVGIDLGINNIATCSNGLRFSGKQAQHTRRHCQEIRSSLQAKGTKSAINTLRRLSGKERRWMASLDHVISKRIVESLKQGEYIVMEKLKGIREKTKVKRNQRYIHKSWTFQQLQSFIEYKALEMSIPIVYIDPRNTSKTCSRCGKIGNRLRHFFSCSCGYRNHADFNASYNISSKGNAFEDGLLSTSPEIASVEAKGSPEQLRPRVVIN